MSVSLKQSYDIEYNGTANVSRMDLFVDTAADLTGLTTFDSITLLQGSTAEDISTGDVYMMQSDGTWVKQPSSNQFANCYTKTEVDDIVIEIGDDLAAVEGTLNTFLATAPALKFTPETSSPSLTNGQRIKFSSANSNNNVEILIGKLNATTNYIQFYINGVDKGYITFDVSRNIDTWS